MLYILKENVKESTHMNTFLNFNKQPKMVNFMNCTKKFDYFEDIQAISLNYEKDNLIILPKKQKDINDYINNLTLEKYN